MCTRPRAALSLQERTGSSHFSCKSRCGSIPFFFTLQGSSRRGPTLHECTLLHAVARLALFPAIVNIQVAASSEPRGVCPGAARLLPHAEGGGTGTTLLLHLVYELAGLNVGLPVSDFFALCCCCVQTSSSTLQFHTYIPCMSPGLLGQDGSGEGGAAAGLRL